MDDVGDDDGWSQHLASAIDGTPLEPTLEDAVRPMSGLLFGTSDGRRQKLDFGEVKGLLRQKRREMAGIIRRELEGCEGSISEDCALAIYLYTVDRPFRLFNLVNSRMCAPGRFDPTAPGGLSSELRKCLPYIKFLRHALLSLPGKYRFKGRCFRGVKWAFPRVGWEPDGTWSTDHDLERHYPPGRKFRWYEFKSASTIHATMYMDCFCGVSGPRTIFFIEGVLGFRIQPFSAIVTEHEVLFLVSPAPNAPRPL